MKINVDLHTCGNGYWSSRMATVHCYDMVLSSYGEDDGFQYGELCVTLTKKSWDVTKHGLIYTDRLFEEELRNFLLAFGFSKKAVKEVNYSEQGMQGRNYVSLDVGEHFCKEWFKRIKK